MWGIRVLDSFVGFKVDLLILIILGFVVFKSSSLLLHKTKLDDFVG